MKLIIDIPEEKYEWICQNNPKATEDMIIGMITHGTPIPDNATNEIETVIRRYTDEQTN